MASQQKTPTCYDILQEFIQDSPLNFWFSFLHTFYVHVLSNENIFKEKLQKFV